MAALPAVAPAPVAQPQPRCPVALRPSDRKGSAHTSGPGFGARSLRRSSDEDTDSGAGAAAAAFAQRCAESYLELSNTLRVFRGRHQLHQAATIFGGSKANEVWDPLCSDVAQMLSDEGFLVLTGGGGGVMEAANVGALRGKLRRTVAIRLDGLNEGKGCNEDGCLAMAAPTLSIRKQLLTENVDLMIFFPGGIGTLDELFAVETQRKLQQWQQDLTLVRYRVVFVGKTFWEPLQAVLLALMGDNGAAPSNRGADQVSRWTILDTVDECRSFLHAHLIGDTRHE